VTVHKGLERELFTGAESRYEIRLFGGRQGGLGMCLGRGHDLAPGESTGAAYLHGDLWACGGTANPTIEIEQPRHVVAEAAGFSR
jgi:hypothetical protein